MTNRSTHQAGQALGVLTALIFVAMLAVSWLFHGTGVIQDDL